MNGHCNGDRAVCGEEAEDANGGNPDIEVRAADALQIISMARPRLLLLSTLMPLSGGTAVAILRAAEDGPGYLRDIPKIVDTGDLQEYQGTD